MKHVLLILISTTILFGEVDSNPNIVKKDITNYSHFSKQHTSTEIFYKICLEGIVYWVYSSENPEQRSNGKGGLSPYYNSKTLSLQRCEITDTKCIDNKAMYTDRKDILCFKQFKEI